MNFDIFVVIKISVLKRSIILLLREETPSWGRNQLMHKRMHSELPKYYRPLSLWIVCVFRSADKDRSDQQYYCSVLGAGIYRSRTKCIPNSPDIVAFRLFWSFVYSETPIKTEVGLLRFNAVFTHAYPLKKLKMAWGKFSTYILTFGNILVQYQNIGPIENHSLTLLCTSLCTLELYKQKFLRNYSMVT